MPRSSAETVGRIRIGTSGWQYASWREVVYPATIPKTKWFSHYVSLFDTVEVNSSFYGLPSEAAVTKWRDEAPPDFLFAVKVGGGFTHRRHLNGAAQSLATHCDRFRTLGALWGPNLLQLPPRWRCDAPRLDDALSAAPTDARWAVEVRHRSWLDDTVFDVLRKHGAALVVHDLIEGEHPRVLTTDWSYLRLHGPGGPDRPYTDRYPRDRLERWGQWVIDVADRGYPVDVYFDNDVGGAAVADAIVLREVVGQAASGR